MRLLEKHPRCKGAHKHVIIEANMSFISADEVANWCRRPEFTNVIIECEDPTPRLRVGIWTSQFAKEAYALILREAVTSLNMSFSTYLVGHNQKEDIAHLYKQLRNFRLERQDPADPAFGKYKYSFTGKTSGGDKDDLVLALMMSMYWGQRKRENMQFQLFARTFGIRL